ncbi:hypothetical protein L195_g039460, partial [Trifolium pratense]
MGPLTSSYVLCGSREANEGKLEELTLTLSLFDWPTTRLLEASSISPSLAWEKLRTLEARALFTFGHEHYSVLSVRFRQSERSDPTEIPHIRSAQYAAT